MLTKPLGPPDTTRQFSITVNAYEAFFLCESSRAGFSFVHGDPVDVVATANAMNDFFSLDGALTEGSARHAFNAAQSVIDKLRTLANLLEPILLPAVRAANQ